MQDHTPSGQNPATAGAVPLVDRFKRLATALLTGAVLITGSVAYTLSEEVSGFSVPMLVAVVALLALAAWLVEMVGYRTSALAPGLTPEEARRQSITQYQERMILRFAIIEAALVVPVALAYVLDGGVVGPMILAGAGTVALMLLHVYPGERTISKTEQSLERDGATSYLREGMFEVTTPTS